MRQIKKSIPFEFVLEELDHRLPYTKPMFGAYGVYIENKIIFILRNRPSFPEDNGIWLATAVQHHQSLIKEFPNMRSLKIFGPGPTGWQVLPLDSDDFEESAFRVCQLVLKNDERIGKVPKTKLKKKISLRSKKKLSPKKSERRRKTD